MEEWLCGHINCPLCRSLLRPITQESLIEEYNVNEGDFEGSVDTEDDDNEFGGFRRLLTNPFTIVRAALHTNDVIWTVQIFPETLDVINYRGSLVTESGEEVIFSLLADFDHPTLGENPSLTWITELELLREWFHRGGFFDSPCPIINHESLRVLIFDMPYGQRLTQPSSRVSEQGFVVFMLGIGISLAENNPIN